jgi:putative peptidoglycan lipid II flippase
MINTMQARQPWWNAWQESSVNRRIFVAMLTVGGLTVLVKVMAAAKELAVAYHFGTQDALDAFLMAFLVPTFALTLVSGSLCVALIPTYIRVREHQGQRHAQRLFSSVMVWIIGLLIAASVVLASIFPYVLPLLAAGFSAEKLALTTSLYYLLLPSLFINGVATIWGAVLNAQDRFAVVATVPIVTSVVTILVLVLLARYWGIYALAVGTVAGSLLEAGLLGWWLARQGLSGVPRWHGKTVAIKEISEQYVPALCASFLMGSTSLIGQSMATMLEPGSVSVLAYGSKVTGLVIGVISLAVGTAVLPHFSRMVAVADWRGVRHTLITYARFIIVTTVPLTMVLIYFSEPMVRLIFQRGAFTPADTQFVASVQALYLLQIPAFVLTILTVQLISALKATRVFMWGAGINLVVCITCNYVLMKWLGVAGIALSTSLMYLINTCFLLVMAMRLLRRGARRATDERAFESDRAVSGHFK